MSRGETLLEASVNGRGMEVKEEKEEKEDELERLKRKQLKRRIESAAADPRVTSPRADSMGIPADRWIT
jgi:hypothetical protein